MNYFKINDIVISSFYIIFMHIYVKIFTGKNVEFEIDPNNNINDLKTQIQNKTQIPSDRQRLTFAGKQLDNENTISSYSIHENSTLHLKLGQPGGFQIFIHDFSGIDKPFEVTPTETIKEFWDKIEKKITATREACQLVYNGQYLKEENTIQDYSIPPHSIIHIVFKRGN